MSSKKKIFNSSLLIAGTTIGAGMLALPIVTAQSGFWPSIAVFALCYLFMMAAGFLLVEALVWYKGEYNLISLSSTLLGKAGKWVSWVLYLFLFYTLTVAYTAGGSDILQIFLGLPKIVSEILFVGILSFFVMKGTRSVHFINHYLMIGMFIAYGALIVTGASKINLDLLKYTDFAKALWGLPVVFTSFSYQGIIPSIKTYLDGDVRALKKSIVIGTTIPLIFYVIWQAFIMGLLPQQLLLEAQNLGKSAVYPLEKQIHSPWIFQFGTFFAFFAITTSFLGVTLGLKDFLRDGLKIKEKGNQILLFGITFLPPFFITQFSYNVFINALRFAGGIGCALLLGLMPILMVWKGRYSVGHQSTMGVFLNKKITLFS